MIALCCRLCDSLGTFAHEDCFLASSSVLVIPMNCQVNVISRRIAELSQAAGVLAMGNDVLSLDFSSLSIATACWTKL